MTPFLANTLPHMARKGSVEGLGQATWQISWSGDARPGPEFAAKGLLNLSPNMYLAQCLRAADNDHEIPFLYQMCKIVQVPFWVGTILC